MNKKIIFAILAIGILTAGASCTTQSATEKGQNVNENNMQKAITSQPVPEVNNFLTRKYVNKWIERQDQPQQEHYVYVLGENGNIIGYYIAQNRPISTCSFVTPNKKEYTTSGATDQLGPAPGIDGVYYGDKDCETRFFFDAETDAMIEVTGMNIITSDQPLDVDARPLRVETTGNETN